MKSLRDDSITQQWPSCENLSTVEYKGVLKNNETVCGDFNVRNNSLKHFLLKDLIGGDFNPHHSL